MGSTDERVSSNSIDTTPISGTALSLKVLLDYEIRASWWASWIGIKCLSGWVSRYFVYKVRRKHNRYMASLQTQAYLKRKGYRL